MTKRPVIMNRSIDTTRTQYDQDLVSVTFYCLRRLFLKSQPLILQSYESLSFVSSPDKESDKRKMSTPQDEDNKPIDQEAYVIFKVKSKVFVTSVY